VCGIAAALPLHSTILRRDIQVSTSECRAVHVRSDNYRLRACIPLLHVLSYSALHFTYSDYGANTKKQKYERIYEKKMATTPEALCKGYAPEFDKYLQYARDLHFENPPDYLFLRGLFRKLFKSHGFAWDYVFDWTLLKQKANPSSVPAALPSVNALAAANALVAARAAAAANARLTGDNGDAVQGVGNAADSGACDATAVGATLGDSTHAAGTAPGHHGNQQSILQGHGGGQNTTKPFASARVLHTDNIPGREGDELPTGPNRAGLPECPTATPSFDLHSTSCFD
ncbi:unnamed protein product, partial [Protopolystoma xenopodis]